ncbi:4-hydroxythreonine-4-phosphate dehydrogenase [uncultured Bosea sp.]|uniref:4-hydroxythreonine-4-phosphate dehydrogenase n=1 Tax=uncultured Bosea sp. TaxID=211457 RepID=UPI0025EA8B1C|nr:4-hydroxythreonine-4-phosphate dehydrogenase [uncultured Bosea sp.]
MAGLDFIFMLTRHDRTVPEAIDHVATALDTGIRHIGFKDIGLPFAELRTIQRLIKAGGAASYLEVVSLDRASEIASVRAAIDLGVDHLLGGTHVEDVAPLLRGSGIRYYPFAGRISGHPSILEGTVAEIAHSARAIAAWDGVHGLDLLAYRSRTDVDVLIAAVCAATEKPVLVAGSIERPEQIEAVRRSGAAGFTIGTAALEGRFPASGSTLRAQLDAIIACR